MRLTTIDKVNVGGLKEFFNQKTVTELNKLKSFLPSKYKPKSARKADLIAVIKKYLLRHDFLEVWDQLDKIQQFAVQEAAYDERCSIFLERFSAKYGESPAFHKKKKSDSIFGGFGDQPTPLKLFLFYGERGSQIYFIPDDLAERVRQFIDPPRELVLEGVSEIPSTYACERASYSYKDKGYVKTITDENQNIVRRDTELDARQDIRILLRLIDQGKISVSDKTRQATKATTKLIVDNISGGDFYPWDPASKKTETIGPIKGFAWPLLLQASRYVKLSGKKLILTKQGKEALNLPQEEVIRTLFEKWQTNKLLDEFNRIDLIKGQSGKGKRYLTIASNRRDVILQALTTCEAGTWFKFDDFSKHMLASGMQFEVSTNPAYLYLFDQRYGHLGYAGYADWPILQGRYLLVFLFEYLATFGLIDVAYIDPQDAVADYTGMWGGEDLDYLSRYDGLLYFRINPLGAYCLGLETRYEPISSVATVKLSVSPGLIIKVIENHLSLDDELYLENFAIKQSNGAWKLDRQKAIAAVEHGYSISDLRTFIEEREENILPETVEGFLTTVERNGNAVSNQGTAVLFQCRDKKLADLIEKDKDTSKYSLRAGSKSFVVKSSHVDRFKQAVNQLGYGVVEG